MDPVNNEPSLEPKEEYTPPAFQPTPQKKGKAGKVIGLIVLVLVLMAAAAAGVYMWKQNELTSQKSDYDSKLAAAEAKKEMTPVADTSRPAHELTPSKTETATTCNADELTLTLENGDGGGAGTTNQLVVLTNSGKRTCTLFGFPGVSLVNDNGNQVGKPADRAKNYTEKTVTLAPTKQAKATLSFEDPSNFDAGECKTGATKLRVYPPNDTGYLSVASTMVTAWCPGFDISPVQ
jgi:hypothetical protein